MSHVSLIFQTEVKRPFAEVVQGFDEKLFRALSSGFPPVEVLRFDGMTEGAEVHLALGGKWGPKWISVMHHFVRRKDLFEFQDTGKTLPFPLKSWHHTHRVAPADASSSVISDILVFKALPGTSGLMEWIMRREIGGRGPRYQHYFERDKG